MRKRVCVFTAAGLFVAVAAQAQSRPASEDAARTVPAALAFFTGESTFTAPTGNIAAAAVIVTVPIIVFVLFFQRRIVAGLTAGAVKG